MSIGNEQHEFRVEWVIEITAGSSEEAARKALAIQRDPNSVATHFEVYTSEGLKNDVDLQEIDHG